MSRLILIRHGQARAFEDHSDRLTDLGVTQARLLGQYLLKPGLRVDQVRTGSLERQVHTAALIGEAYRTGWPEAVVDQRWNEYDATGVLRHLAPQLAASEASFAQLASAAEQYRRTADANRHFQRMFEVLMNRWTAGELDHPFVEPWATFRTRAESALREILAETKSTNIVLVSSGGPIAAAVQLVLEAPPGQALELNWRMRNSSITELLFSRGRVTLDQFNAVPHLDAEQVTYR